MKHLKYNTLKMKQLHDIIRICLNMNCLQHSTENVLTLKLLLIESLFMKNIIRYIGNKNQ
jgi:hypothetical protein